MLNRSQRLFACWLFGLALFGLTGCGGSSGGGTPGETPVILVDVGQDISADEQTIVTLSAEARAQSQNLTYTWRATPALTITQSDNTVSTASVTLPETRQQLEFVITLSVSDENGNSGSDTLNLTVSPVNTLPVADIVFVEEPTYPDFILPAGVAVNLDGSASSDADAPAGIDPISAWLWQQTAGPDVLSGVDVNNPILQFNAPVQAAQSQIQLQLTVTDQENGQASIDVDFTVQDATSTLPAIDAGRPQQVYPGELVMLLGTANSTVPSALPLTASWQSDALTTVIDDPTSLQTFAVMDTDSVGQTVTFTLDVTDQNGNTVEDRVEVIVAAQPRFRLNDSGVTFQADNTSISSSFVADLPGQDGHLGQDAIDTYGNFEKAGRGQAGFDFTRLNSNGDEVDDLTQPFSCVRDNVTGLVWEVKTDDAGLHDKDHTYSWYFASNNGGFEGDLNGTGTSCSLTQCNTRDFIDAVNAEGLCGFFDWRVPSHDELLSILHLGIDTLPMLDTDYFPATYAASATPLWFWTRIASADGVNDADAQNAWALDFASGVDNFLNKSSATRIRLVRAGR